MIESTMAAFSNRHQRAFRMNRLQTAFTLACFILFFSAGTAASDENYQSQTVHVNGVDIHYLKAGSGSTPLVLIHGFGETSHMWIPLFAEFGGDYTIIAPDIRGLGDSSRPDSGYDKKTAALDIHELVKSLGYERIDLVGHDIGLMIAYAYAAQFPTEVTKLALLEAPIPGVGEVWEQIFTNPVLWHFHFVDSPIALDLVKGRERTFLEHFWQSLSANPQAPAESDRQLYAQAYAQDGAMRSAFEYFHQGRPVRHGKALRAEA
jgi:pimeloyl-ACP methyl ester carboxylesterase